MRATPGTGGRGKRRCPGAALTRRGGKERLDGVKHARGGLTYPRALWGCLARERHLRSYGPSLASEPLLPTDPIVAARGGDLISSKPHKVNYAKARLGQFQNLP